MTDTPNSPCCTHQRPCCGPPVPGPPKKRKSWKTVLFIAVLLAGSAVAAYSLMGKKDACSTQDCCSEPCGE
jgi:multidrug resistance efflux pump